MTKLAAHGRRLAGIACVVALLSVLQISDADVAGADVTSSTNVSATIDQAFTFSVAGKNDGACNGAPITGTGSTAEAISLGRVDKSSRATGGQTLTVSSNAVSGFSVYAKVDGPLSDDKGNAIANFGASNASPGPFAAPGTEAFGYTTDSLLRGPAADRFLGDRWAGVSTSDNEVMTGDPTANSTSCIAYQITISEETVGGFYGNNVTYTAIPAF